MHNFLELGPILKVYSSNAHVFVCSLASPNICIWNTTHTKYDVTNCTPHNNLSANAREELGDCVSHHTLKRFWITQISFPEICRLAQMQLLFTSTAGNLFLLLLPDITPHNILYQAQTLASSLSTDFPILYYFFLPSQQCIIFQRLWM